MCSREVCGVNRCGGPGVELQEVLGVPGATVGPVWWVVRFDVSDLGGPFCPVWRLTRSIANGLGRSGVTGPTWSLGRSGARVPMVVRSDVVRECTTSQSGGSA